MDTAQKINLLINHLLDVDKTLDSSTEFEKDIYSLGFDKGARMMIAYLMKYGYLNSEFYDRPTEN